MGDHDCTDKTHFDYINRHMRSNPGSIGLAFYRQDVLDTGGYSCSDVKWEIQGHCIVFASNLSVSETKVTLNVLRYVTDDEGLPMINRSHLDAVAKYIELCLAKRMRWRKGDTLPESTIQLLTREWNKECSLARANSSKSSESAYREMVNMFNDPISGYGMTLVNSFTS